MTSGILFTFLLGALEFTRAFMMLHSADNAAYEGARRGIVPGATSQKVKDEALTVMKTMGAKEVNVIVNPSTITNSTKEVEVRIEVPMNKNSLVAPFLFKDRVISSEMTMLREDFDQTSVP